MCDNCKIQMDIRLILDLIVQSIASGRADNAQTIAESAIEQLDKAESAAEDPHEAERQQAAEAAFAAKRNACAAVKLNYDKMWGED